MTPEAQRIAIAEACGWTEIEIVYNEPEPDDLVGYHPNRKPHGRGSLDYVKELVPNYLSDLNAMHEAEKVLTEAQQREYEQHLFEMFNFYVNRIYRATAVQRAEAFLRTLNRWDSR